MTIRLKEVRERSKMTQREVAEATGIPLGTLRRWEQHKNEPDSDSLVLLADLYGASVDEMLGSKFADELSQLTDDERELLTLYRACNDKGREYMLQVAQVTAGLYSD